jgi:hypothetical protein
MSSDHSDITALQAEVRASREARDEARGSNRKAP